MKLRYRVKFIITNLDVNELRDFKINLVNSNHVMEFDTDDSPRIPKSGESIKISDREFKSEKYDIEYVSEDEDIINVINVYIYDIEKKEKEEREIELKKANDEANRMMKLWKSARSEKYGYYEGYEDRFTDYWK